METKIGYLYLVTDNKRKDNFFPYHYFPIGEIVECISISSSKEEKISYRFVDSAGTVQYLRPEHVFEIGEI